MMTNVDDFSGVFTNAEKIKGVPVDNTDIGEGKVLAYDGVNGKLIYKEVEGGSGSGSGSGVWGGITGTLSVILIYNRLLMVKLIFLIFIQ